MVKKKPSWFRSPNRLNAIPTNSPIQNPDSAPAAAIFPGQASGDTFDRTQLGADDLHVLYREVLVSEVVDHFLGAGYWSYTPRDMGYSGGAVDLTVRTHDGPVGRGVDVGMEAGGEPARAPRLRCGDREESLRHGQWRDVVRRRPRGACPVVPVIRRTASRTMTAPTIAVIHVDTLKNVLREWTCGDHAGRGEEVDGRDLVVMRGDDHRGSGRTGTPTQDRAALAGVFGSELGQHAGPFGAVQGSQ